MPYPRIVLRTIHRGSAAANCVPAAVRRATLRWQTHCRSRFGIQARRFGARLRSQNFFRPQGPAKTCSLFYWGLHSGIGHMVNVSQSDRAALDTVDLKRRIVSFMRGASTEITPSEQSRLPELARVLPTG